MSIAHIDNQGRLLVTRDDTTPIISTEDCPQCCGCCADFPQAFWAFTRDLSEGDAAFLNGFRPVLRANLSSVVSTGLESGGQGSINSEVDMTPLLLPGPAPVGCVSFGLLPPTAEGGSTVDWPITSLSGDVVRYSTRASLVAGMLDATLNPALLDCASLLGRNQFAVWSLFFEHQMAFATGQINDSGNPLFGLAVQGTRLQFYFNADGSVGTCNQGDPNFGAVTVPTTCCTGAQHLYQGVGRAFADGTFEQDPGFVSADTSPISAEITGAADSEIDAVFSWSRSLAGTLSGIGGASETSVSYTDNFEVGLTIPAGAFQSCGGISEEEPL